LACFANCVIRSFGDKFHYEELPVELTYSERVWKRAGELEPNSLLELALSHVHLRQEPGQEFQRKAYNQALVKKVHAAVRGDGQIRRATMKETMHEAVIRELVATTNRSELQRQLESVEHYFGEEYGYTPVQCAFLKPLLEEALRRTPPEEIRPEGNHEQAVHEDDIVEPAFEGAAPVVEEDVIAPDGRGSWAS
jgi:hypothetical protein